MTKFLTASRRRYSSAAFTRTRHETMMTTTDLTIVEWYHVVDRQSPRTQSADTQPLLLDCSRRPDTMVRHSNSGFDERFRRRSTQEFPELSKIRPPTIITQSSVPQNTAQHRPRQFGQSSRLFSTVKQCLFCRSAIRPLKRKQTSKTSVSCYSPADWLISSHVTLIVAGIDPINATIAA